MDKLNLVIFDCDGVLIDSETIANNILLEMLTELEIVLTIDDVFDIFVGKSMSQCVEIIREQFGKYPPENFTNEFRQRVLQAFITDLLPIKGIHEVLSKLNLSYCVASNSSHDWINTALDATKLLPYFSDKIFSAKDVQRSKPYPDVFLYAAKKMGFSPKECVVIEDTPTGVRAGVDAGMTVFGYAELIQPEKLREVGASVVFNDMRLLPKLLEQQNQHFLNSAN
ncbi:HAD family hydrolase [Nostoc sp. FACHB-152]|uniref:HAD family hydrolase n=1 Tax=unclassified Nostoc TaxID=2593658 RepID=UPI0016895C77|nr:MULTISPECIES: HAD family hydrolase [unclassified Nostoc]MBD2449957.1 HAD family hydrolase [Nostoc sp. FACHB-152]MBD2468451.1 HAD family hydrolase [Nostoc sp. FACHB-145]